VTRPASADQLLLSESTADGRQFYYGCRERWTGKGLCQRVDDVCCFTFLVLFADVRRRFMANDRSRLFLTEYESSSLQYQNISRS